MKYFLIIFLATFYSFSGLAQPGTDTLRSLLKVHQAEDSTRVRLLLKYGKKLFFIQQDSMMYYADEALRIAKKINWKEGIADAYQLKGVSYSYVLSDPANAIDYYQKALSANEQLGRKTFQWQTLANIALLHYDQEEYPQALHYYKKAGSVLAGIQDKSGEGRLLMNVGHLYYDMGNPKEAMQSYEKSLLISEENKDSLVAANVLNSMGYILLRDHKDSAALGYIRRSIKMAELTGNKITLASALVNLSLVNLQTKNYEQAEKLAKEGLNLATAVGNLQFRRQSWEALQKIYEETGRYQQSLEAYKEYNLLNDSLVNSENKKEITRKEMQFQFDKKRALDQAELQRQTTIKNALIAGAALLLLAALAWLILYKKKRDAVEAKKEAEFKTMVADTEMKALRSQMNPHFIFNSLNAIGDYMLKNNTAMADEYLGKFSALMRMVLENSEQKEIPLSEEIKTVNLYMDLEALRLDHRFTFEIKTAQGMDIDNILVPPLLLQPFIENSIIHGLAGKDGKGKINIHLSVEGDTLLCRIEDNGIGIRNSRELQRQPETKKKQSLGIKITQTRIKILNRHNQLPRAALEIFDIDDGTRVEIKLPLTLNF